ncbi:MAG: YdcF family protein [Clostridiales bacterium]|nr:YdcF family protein [Clostridiales bacterium]
MIKLILAVISVTIVFLNIGPLITTGEKSIGVLIGLATGAVIAVYLIFFDRVNSFFADFWDQSNLNKAILSFLSSLICLFLVLFSVTFVKVIVHCRQSKAKTEYIIVLGCQVSGERPGIFLKKRIAKAYDYLKENPSSKAILSGGQGSGENISEGRCMFDTLTRKGIDENRLIIEDSSTSTDENFRNSLETLKSEGMEITEITIVTNDFHQYRSSLIAKKLGLKAYSCPCATPFMGFVPFAVREVLAAWAIKLKMI